MLRICFHSLSSFVTLYFLLVFSFFQSVFYFYVFFYIISFFSYSSCTSLSSLWLFISFCFFHDHCLALLCLFCALLFLLLNKVRNVNFWRRSSAVPVANHRSLSYRRLRGAFLGYNSLDPPMELWPDARWGNVSALSDKRCGPRLLRPLFNLPLEIIYITVTAIFFSGSGKLI